MTDPRWVTAHGKQILVETLETPSMTALVPRKHQQFVKVPLQWVGGRSQGDGNARRHGLDFTAAHGLENEEHDVYAIQRHAGAIRRQP
jgi:hypothetical protein